jgi:putative SOS response-associated peptidase YedK
MCGRFSLRTTLEEVSRNFRAAADTIDEWVPRYNIAPTQDVLAVRVGGGAAAATDDRPGSKTSRGGKSTTGRQIVLLHWGLVPSWSDGPDTGGRFINARAESANIKPTFRDAFWNRRCLVAADGFYEWRAADGVKQPYFIRRADGAPFGFAGLWERWDRSGPETIESCTILTTRPNSVVEPLHDRMPVIIPPEDYGRWLDPMAADMDELRTMFEPFPAEELTAYPVSRRVNDPRNDDPSCIDPDADEPAPELELDLFGRRDRGSTSRDD